MRAFCVKEILVRNDASSKDLLNIFPVEEGDQKNIFFNYQHLLSYILNKCTHATHKTSSIFQKHICFFSLTNQLIVLHVTFDGCNRKGSSNSCHRLQSFAVQLIVGHFWYKCYNFKQYSTFIEVEKTQENIKFIHTDIIVRYYSKLKEQPVVSTKTNRATTRAKYRRI